MANSRSARERIRSNERKHVHNRGIRASVRTKVAKARRALLEGDAAAATPEEQLRLAVSALDRAGRIVDTLRQSVCYKTLHRSRETACHGRQNRVRAAE